MRPALIAAAVAGLLAFGAAGSASAASFDCGKARTANERAICNDRWLNDQDVRMSQLYDIVRKLVPMGSRGAIMDEQTIWLKQRNGCGADRRCIANAYARRIGQLNAVLERRVYPQGPF